VRRFSVLNTRPREQAAELSRRLSQAGFDVVEAPAIQIVPTWDPAELGAVRADLASGAFDWVVLVSQNAGHGLEEQLPGTRLVCGASTGHALGLRPSVRLEKFSAAAALEALRPLVQPGQRVLVPRAAEGRDELVDGLRLLGIEVTAPVAYNTAFVAASAQRLRDGGVDVVTVCSPSAVRSLAHAIDTGSIVVCLGETTAEAARLAGLRVDAVAQRTTMRALVEAVKVALDAHEVPA
jgi:uroporphyrinogen III methyltransferase/synthase